MNNTTGSLEGTHRSGDRAYGMNRLFEELGIKTSYSAIGGGTKGVFEDFFRSCDEQIAYYSGKITSETRWKRWFVGLTFGALLAFPVLLWAIDPILNLFIPLEAGNQDVWSNTGVVAAALSGLLALQKSFSTWFRTRYREGGLREAKAKLEDQRLTIKSNWYGRAELPQSADGQAGIASAASLRLERAQADAGAVLASLKQATADRDRAQASNDEAGLTGAKARVDAATLRIATTCNDVLDAKLALNDEEKPTTRLGKEIAADKTFDPAFLQAVMAATLECRKIAREETVAHFAQMKLPDVDLAKSLSAAETSARTLLTAFKPQATADARKAADVASKRSALTAADQNLKMLTAESDRLRGLVTTLEAANLDSSSAKADLAKSEALRLQAYEVLLKARNTLLLAGGSLAT